jgi:hypothetical protein
MMRSAGRIRSLATVGLGRSCWRSAPVSGGGRIGTLGAGGTREPRA